MTSQLKRYFNKMAEMVSCVYKLFISENTTYQDCLSVLHDKNSTRYLKLYNELPEIIDENYIYKKVRRCDLLEEFYERLEEFYVRNCHDAFQMLLTIYFMDRAIKDECDIMENFDEYIEQIDGLNDNYKETHFILLHKSFCNWGHQIESTNVNSFLETLYCIDISKLKNAEIVNYVVDQGLITGIDNGKLRIAISPTLKRKVLDINSEPYSRIDDRTNTEKYFFHITSLINELEIQQLVYSNILEAGKNETDILVFPEMIGSKQMLYAIQKKLDECDKKKPSLIVFPSIWNRTDEDKQNTNSSVMMTGDGEIIFEQYKRVRFYIKVDGKEIYEDISCESHNVINVLHINEIGRICIVICKDYLDKDNRRMILDNIFPTLVISPSFSTGNFEFIKNAQEGFSVNCNWVWCNTCSAINHGEQKKENFDIIGLITKLSKKCKKDEKMYNDFPGVNNCDRECSGCIYYSDIPLILRE